MHCDEFEIRLHDLLDERQAADRDPVLRAHAADCSACAALLREYKSLLNAVSILPTPRLAADFASRVAAQALPRPPAGSVRRLTGRGRVSLSVAALLLAALLPALVWLSPALRTVPQPSDGVAVGSHLATTPPPAVGVGEDENAQQRSLAAMRQSLADVLDLLPVSNSDLSPQIGMTDSLTSKLKSEIAPGVEPLAITAGRSLVALFRVMPAGIAPPNEAGLKQ